MAKINRLKVVLVEKEKSGKWLQNKWASLHVLLASGAAIVFNLTCKL